MKIKLSKFALRISLIYAVIGGAWILLSGRVLFALVPDPEVRTQLEIYKGWAFVIVTALLLYLLLRGQLWQWEREATERKRVEGALQNNERFLRLVMDLVPHFIFVKDRKSRHLLVNRACAEACKLTPEQMVGRSDLDLSPGSILAKSYIQDDQEVIASGRPKFVPEEKLTDAYGQTRFLQTTKIPFPSSAISLPVAGNGEPAILGVAVDITERKKAENALRESHAQLTEALQIGRLAYWEYDVARDQFTFNDQFYSILRTTAEREGGYTMSAAEYAKRFVHPDDIAVVEEETQKALTTTDPNYNRQLDHRIICGNGEVGYFSIHIRIQKDAQGRTVKTYGANMDITERKRAELQLAESRNYFSKVINSITDPIFVKDRQHRWVLLNEAFCDFMGHKRDDLLGKSDRDFFPAHEADVFWSKDELVFSTKTENTNEEKFTDGRGTIRTILTKKVLYMDEKGEQFILGIIRDITERSRTEQTLQMFQFSIDQASDAVFWMTRDAGFSYVNDQACRSLGYTREELMQLHLWDIDPVFPRERWDTEWKQFQENRQGGIQQVETFHRRKDGSMFPVNISSKHLWFGDTELHVAVARDITERRQMEEALAQERSLLRTLIDNLPDGIYAKDAAGRKILANPADYKNYHCQTEAEAIGKTDFDLFPKDIAEKFWADDQKVIQGQPVINREEYFLSDEGEKRWLMTSKLPLRDQSGKVVGLVGIGRDITDRRRKEHHFKQLTDCFLSFGPDPVENINRMTALCGKLLGATCALYNRLDGGLLCSLGQWNTPPDYVPKDKPEGHICYDVIRKGSDDLFIIRNLPETSYFKSDPNVARYGLKTYIGKAVLFSNVAVGSLCIVFQNDYELDTEGRRIITIIAAAIATEENRLQALEKLRTREESYRALADNVPDSVARIDRNLRFVYVNRTVEAMVCLPASVILGKTNVELNLPAQDEWHKTTQAVFDTGRPNSFEFEVPGPDGPQYFEVRLMPERSANGQVEFVLALTRNVTEQKKAEAERQKLETQLRQSQKMEAIGQLAGGVAHDFNNMLTVIQGNASILLNPQLNAGERKESAQQIVRAAERAAGLTRQLLLFSRKQVLQAVPLNLNEVVGNMTKMLQRILGEDVSLNANYAPNLPVILADPGMIEQILLNLAVNSRDAMPNGGRLTITTSAETLDKDQAEKNTGAAPGLYACINVTDTGSGITPEILPRIFEPFFTTKEIGRGTGLGLATVYGIIQQHHGWVGVTSQVGQGTSFRIYLPAAKGPLPKSSAAATVSKLPGGSETILLVEDEPPVRLLASNLLQRCGYTVLVAESGAAALPVWKAHREKIHLLLTDMVMPEGISGRELAEKLKADRPALKIIYTSGYSADIIGREPRLVDGSNFLQKPYHPLKLAQIVRDCLDRKPTPS